MSKRSVAKSEKYHDEVKARLSEGARKIAKANHEGTVPVAILQQDSAEIAQMVFAHEVARHTNKKGRKVR